MTLGQSSKGKINVYHSHLKNDTKPHSLHPQNQHRDSFDDDHDQDNDDDYYDEEEEEEEKAADGEESDGGAQRIEKKHVRGQKKKRKFNKSKVFNRVVRGNVMDQAAILESDSSPPPDNFDPVESRPEVMSISDNLHGLSLHQDTSSYQYR
jgi:hypothetical protein